MFLPPWPEHLHSVDPLSSLSDAACEPRSSCCVCLHVTLHPIRSQCDDRSSLVTLHRLKKSPARLSCVLHVPPLSRCSHLINLLTPRQKSIWRSGGPAAFGYGAQKSFPSNTTASKCLCRSGGGLIKTKHQRSPHIFLTANLCGGFVCF